MSSPFADWLFANPGDDGASPTFMPLMVTGNRNGFVNTKGLAATVKDMSGARLEVLVEPFRENDPGPHVVAAVEALTEAGFSPDMGPFATSAEGELDTLIPAIAEMLLAAFEQGATSIQLRLDRSV